MEKIPKGEIQPLTPEEAVCPLCNTRNIPSLIIDIWEEMQEL